MRLYGAMHQPGKRMGRAALATRRGGPPLPPDGFEPRDEVSEFSALPEPPDVILVLRDLRDLPGAWPDWATVVGIVAECDAADDPPAGTPCLAGVAGAMRAVHDGDLLLLDADDGSVTIDPDMRAVAEFQRAQNAGRPGSRFVLGHEHLPAATIDGAAIRVAARVGRVVDLDAAMRAGADALLAPWGSSAPIDAATRVRRMAQLSAGKPITLLVAEGALSARAVARAAAEVDLTVALPVASVRTDIERWRDELATARSSLHAERLRSGTPRDAAWGSLGDPFDPADLPVSRLIVRCSADRWPPDVAAAGWLEEVSRAALCAMIPLELELESAQPVDVEFAIGSGAAAVIVAPERVSAVKEVVRGTRAEECREAFRRRVGGSGGQGQGGRTPLS